MFLCSFFFFYTVLSFCSFRLKTNFILDDFPCKILAIEIGEPFWGLVQVNGCLTAVGCTSFRRPLITHLIIYLSCIGTEQTHELWGIFKVMYNHVQYFKYIQNLLYKMLSSLELKLMTKLKMIFFGNNLKQIHIV